MLARKCDRCGKLYEIYSMESTIETDEFAVACIRTCATRSGSPENDILDLCPDCMGEFMDWFNRK